MSMYLPFRIRTGSDLVPAKHDGMAFVARRTTHGRTIFEFLQDVVFMKGHCLLMDSRGEIRELYDDEEVWAVDWTQPEEPKGE